jgi:GNAT superfamily N-acetyltransferase
MGTIVRSLEMTSPGQLRPGRQAPASLDVQEVGPNDAASLGSIYRRIGAPLGWVGRMRWSDARWRRELVGRGVRAWLVLIEGDVAGMIELEAAPDGDVGIVILGLVPERIGQGFGGSLLTIATELAWTLPGPDGQPTRRVWVQTSSADHAHALPNYQARGFRVFAIEGA